MIEFLKIKHLGLHRIIIILSILCLPISIEVATYFESLFYKYDDYAKWVSYNFDNLPKLYFEFFSTRFNYFTSETHYLYKLISLFLFIIILIFNYVFFSLIIKIISWILEGFKNE